MVYQYWPGGFMLFVVLCPGTPEGFENAQFRNHLLDLSYLYIFFIIL